MFVNLGIYLYIYIIYTGDNKCTFILTIDNLLTIMTIIRLRIYSLM